MGKSVFWFLSIVNGVTCILLCVCMAISLPAFHMPFYEKSYDKYNTLDRIPVTDNELNLATQRLLAYMKNDAPDLSYQVIVDGTPREFFNEKEKNHMVDVKYLFDILFVVRNLTFVCSLCIIFFMLWKKQYKILARGVQIMSILFLSVLAIGALLISLDFSAAFEQFHLIFFTNDLWLLDMSTDWLLNMVPLPFFIDISIVAAVIFAVEMAILIIGSFAVTNFFPLKNRKG